MAKLTAAAVKAAKNPGRYSDGDGLFLEVRSQGAGSWIVRVQKNGKRRDIGLGSASKVSLAQARERAALIRSQVEAGIDPVAERKKAAGVPTFREAASIVHASQRWRNAKHRAQWLATLETYAFPHFGEVRVSEVERGAVHDALAEIWLAKNETARRVRQRIGAVIDWAVAKGYREASLPWAAINKGLPRRSDKTQRHHAALPHPDLPAFIVQLRERETWGRLALEAAILTAARSGEVRGATWDEIDLERGLWTIPAARMKGGREHVVPLSPAALRVFERAKALHVNGARYVFHGSRLDKPMSDMTLMKVLRDMGQSVTAHGFRSTFRDWVSEQTNFPGEVAEAALAHAIGNKVEAAYRRGNLLEKRKALMDAWGAYCDGVGQKVVRLVAAS